MKSAIPQDLPALITLSNPASYILLPEGRYGRHDYPDILVGMQRLAYNAEVEAVNQRKRSYYQNTAKAASNTHVYDFMGKITHAQAIELNKELGNVTLSLVLGREFLRLLQKGIDSRRNEVYDGNRDVVKKDILKQVFADATEVRDPWRAEWYDTSFKKEGTQWKVTYPLFNTDHWEYTTENLEDSLMEDREPGIQLKEWLEHATSQGLPLPGAGQGRKMNYWHPRNGSVVRLSGDSGGLGLGCCRGPACTGASLGVRAARAKIRGAV